MNVGAISQSALLGINRGITQADQASSKLAGAEQLADNKTKDSAQELVELKQAELQVQASARVAQTAGDVIGSIIDIQA
ncbi:MAG: hypothetical protein KUG64_06450 [Cycloclasticus sp.]|nr:hypothetical protein [Cycloclasticus sp.]